MSLLTDLEQGCGGVRLAIPARFTVDDERSDVAALHDAERRVVWHLSRHDHHLDLRPEHQELLVRDVERHTRALFETYSRSLSDTPFKAERLRTEDPTWSPVVSVERVQIGEHDALTVIHRMSYQPGNEMLMGHLLVPIRSGLFELRVLASAMMTGMRESMLGATALKTAGDEPSAAVMKRLGQKHFDDPQHDVLFPDHPLSRVRAELRALLQDGVVAVTEPDDPLPDGEALLPGLGCAVTPPPRYARAKTAPGFVQWSRLSFAGTDGVQLLTVLRSSDVKVPQRGAQRRLAKVAEEVTPGVRAEGRDERTRRRAPAPRAGRARAGADLSGVRSDGRGRAAPHGVPLARRRSGPTRRDRDRDGALRAEGRAARGHRGRRHVVASARRREGGGPGSGGGSAAREEALVEGVVGAGVAARRDP